MPESDRAVREPAEYEQELARIGAIADAVAAHNELVALLQFVRRDRELTDLPEYDPLIRKIEREERAYGDRVVR